MTSHDGRFELTLAKEDFKFSAAHFTLFPDGSAELLHGHNYRVTVAVEGSVLDGDGLLIGLEALKAAVRAACDRLDSRTLVPARSPRLEVTRDGEAVEVRRGGRAYRFPAADVLLLPVVNTSMELLARLLWQELAPAARGAGAERLEVGVEETPGQRCSYRAALTPEG